MSCNYNYKQIEKDDKQRGKINNILLMEKKLNKI